MGTPKDYHLAKDLHCRDKGISLIHIYDFEDLNKQKQRLKNDLEYPDYWDWNLANSSQQVLRQLNENWKSFFSAIKDWKEHPDKYTGKPKIPKYLKKDGVIEFALTYQQLKFTKWTNYFSKVYE